MLDLTHTTFLIPLHVEHEDRYNNANIVMHYLNKYFNTTVLIYEIIDGDTTKLDFIKQFNNLHVKHYTQKATDVFHRTQYLNKMLNEADTPVVVNYDIDVLLKPETYIAAQNYILDGQLDVVYPYGLGSYQVMVEKTLDRQAFLDILDLDQIEPVHKRSHTSRYGHCVFFDRTVYCKGGAENENFISWGPEDEERANRFKKLDYKVDWLPETYVYHFEHYRSANSSGYHVHAHHNHTVCNELLDMSKEQLLNYYENQEYLKQYDNILHTKQEQSKVPQNEHTIYP